MTTSSHLSLRFSRSSSARRSPHYGIIDASSSRGGGPEKLKTPGYKAVDLHAFYIMTRSSRLSRSLSMFSKRRWTSPCAHARCTLKITTPGTTAHYAYDHASTPFDSTGAIARKRRLHLRTAMHASYMTSLNGRGCMSRLMWPTTPLLHMYVE